MSRGSSLFVFLHYSVTSSLLGTNTFPRHQILQHWICSSDARDPHKPTGSITVPVSDILWELILAPARMFLFCPPPPSFLRDLKVLTAVLLGIPVAWEVMLCRWKFVSDVSKQRSAFISNRQALSWRWKHYVRCLGALGPTQPRHGDENPFGLSVCSCHKPVLSEIPDLQFKMWIFGGRRSGVGAMFYVRSVWHLTAEQPHTPLSAIYEISCYNSVHPLRNRVGWESETVTR
jgi:hypothetical protein